MTGFFDEASLLCHPASRPSTRTPRSIPCLMCLMNPAQTLTLTPLDALPQRSPQETLLKIKTQEVFYPQNLSPGSVNFMRGALVRDPAQRMGMPDLMAHPWVLGHRRAPTMPHMRSRAATQVG